MTISKWQNELMKNGYSETYLKTIHNQLSAIFNFGMKYFGMTSIQRESMVRWGKSMLKKMNFYTYDEF